MLIILTYAKRLSICQHRNGIWSTRLPHASSTSRLLTETIKWLNDMCAIGRTLVIITLLVVYIVSGCPEWLLSNQWHVAFAHHFFHVNIFHLAVNCISLWNLFKIKRSAYSIVLAFFFATISWFMSPAHPVGISNFIFAYIGMLTPPISHPWWKSRNTIMFLAINAVFVFIPQISALTHMVSFALGSLWAGAKRKINRLSHDIG